MAAPEHNNERLIIITAPSGAGKTSITKFLLDNFPQLAFSVSAATRPKRSHEINGKDYYFMDEETFKEKIHQDAFVEWEMVYEGKYYGTLKSELRRIWDLGKTPVLDIDVKGAIHVEQEFPHAVLSIFVEPPSIDELRRRLQSRGTESETSLRDRLNKAAYELSFKHHFDKVIVNNDLGQACAQASAFIGSFLRLP
jgi:guanylate kinase